MLRHRPRRKPAASAHQWLAFSKTVTVAPSERRRVEKRGVVEAVRKEVWLRSKGRCECCGDTEEQTAQKTSGRIAHELHETYPRSLTARMPAWMRVDSRWCVRVCANCHRKFTEHRWGIWFASLDHGANGNRCIDDLHKRPRGFWFTPRQVWLVAVGRNLPEDIN